VSVGVAPEIECLANISDKKTRRAYKIDIAEFWACAGLTELTQLRTVGRMHVMAWRNDIHEHTRRLG
jgi:hypothetical protein